jgi:hypothetical protein
MYSTRIFAVPNRLQYRELLVWPLQYRLVLLEYTTQESLRPTCYLCHLCRPLPSRKSRMLPSCQQQLLRLLKVACQPPLPCRLKAGHAQRQHLLR